MQDLDAIFREHEAELEAEGLKKIHMDQVRWDALPSDLKAQILADTEAMFSEIADAVEAADDEDEDEDDE